MGTIIAELNNPNIRELIFQNYRINYRIINNSIEIITVIYGISLLDL